MRRTLLAALPISLALASVACSLTNLDGFTGGGPLAPPDGGGGGGGGGANDASTTTPGPNPVDAGHDATTTATEGGASSTDPYGDAVRADAPTSWWRFEDAAGSLTLDDEMNHHDGHVLARDTNPIAIQWGVPGAVGKAAQLGIKAGYFNIGDAFDFAGLAAFTLEAWVKDDAPAQEYEGIFNKRTDTDGGSANSGWVVFLHQGDRALGFQFWKNTDVTASVSTTLPTGFHHVVVSATRHDVSVDYVLFVDGMPVGDDLNQTVEELDTTANLILGYGYNGVLDEIAIYEHALSSERISTHYKAARP